MEKEHLNCCQKILLAYADELDLSLEQARKLGVFLGRGMNCGEICGVLVGAQMLLGLSSGSQNDKEKSIALTQAFKEQFGAVRCGDLKAKTDNHDPVPCPVVLEQTIELLHQYIQK